MNGLAWSILRGVFHSILFLGALPLAPSIAIILYWFRRQEA
jgi:hypothetical protein